MLQAESIKNIMKTCISRDKNPRISVVLAVYNHEQFVGQTVESIIGQSFEDWELIIIDDCSKDGSADAVRKYIQGPSHHSCPSGTGGPRPADHEDERIRFYQAEKNRGTVRTFNELLKKARGEYVAFIGSDDIWHSGKLQEQIEYMEQHKEMAVCFSWAEFIDENGRLYSEDEKECDYDTQIFMHKNCTQGEVLRCFFDSANYFCHPSALIRSEVIREIGGFDLRFRQLHDFEYWVRVLQKYPVHIIQKPLVQYRRLSTENDSLSAVNKQNMIRFMNEIQTIIYTMIKEMNRDIFCEAFHDLLKKEITTDARLVSEKYFVLLGWHMMGVNNRQPAARFLNEFLDDSVIECLEEEYQYSLNDYYEELGNAWKLYPFDFYQEYEILEEEHQALKKAYRSQEKAVARLNREIQGMSRTLSWRITKPLREVKRLGVKKGK